MKSALSVAVLPVQYLVDWPVRFVGWVETHLQTQQQLLTENTQLRDKQLMLQVELQRLMTLRNENEYLRSLLSASNQLDTRVVMGRLLALNVDPYDPQGVVDKGEQDHIYVGQPVLDAYGVVGQVTQVGSLASRVLFLTSTRSAIPVQDARNGFRSVVVGGGVSGELKLVHVPDTVDVRQGDSFVTSGLGLVFPIGYPVGVVKSVKHVAGERFAQIIIEPRAQLNHSREVLLVWTNHSKLIKQVKELLKGSS